MAETAWHEMIATINLLSNGWNGFACNYCIL